MSFKKKRVDVLALNAFQKENVRPGYSLCAICFLFSKTKEAEIKNDGF